MACDDVDVERVGDACLWKEDVQVAKRNKESNACNLPRKESNCSRKTEDMLRGATGGVYTSMLIRGRSRVSMWNSHVSRLVDGYEELYFDPRMEESIDAVESNRLKKETLKKEILRKAKESIFGSLSAVEDENNVGRMLCVCVSQEPGSLVPVVQAMITEVNQAPVHFACRLHILGCRRRIAHIKYTDWVTERVSLVKLKPERCQEVLLCNESDGSILEGMISNFFVVRRGDDGLIIQTASVREGALPGIARGAVFQVCKALDIEILEKAPRLIDRTSWLEAFISNSVKGITPVSCISWYESSLRPGHPTLVPSGNSEASLGNIHTSKQEKVAFEHTFQHHLPSHWPIFEKISGLYQRLQVDEEVDLLSLPSD